MRKGIYLLPNLITLSSMFAGFYSIVASFNSDYERAAWAILVASVFDVLDGWVARMTHTATRFGIEIDERAIPINDAVQGACELLGFDPMYVANEGKVVVVAGFQGVTEDGDITTLGAAVLDGQLIEAPHVRRAERILAIAARLAA